MGVCLCLFAALALPVCCRRRFAAAASHPAKAASSQKWFLHIQWLNFSFFVFQLVINSIIVLRETAGSDGNKLINRMEAQMRKRRALDAAGNSVESVP